MYALFASGELFQGESDTRTVVSHKLEVLELRHVQLPSKSILDSFIRPRCVRDCLRRFECNKIMYEKCTNLDAEMASLMRRYTRATHDNFHDFE